MRAKGAPDVYYKVFWETIVRRDVLMYEFRLPQHDFILVKPYLENVAK